MKRIYKNRSALLKYFEEFEKNASTMQRHEVRTLINMLRDDALFLLIGFLYPVIEEYESLNARFQTETTDLFFLEDNLNLLYSSIWRRAYEKDHKGQEKKLHVSRIDLGSQFKSRSSELIKSKKMTEEQLRYILEKGAEFLYELIEQTKIRMPETRVSLAAYSKMLPKNIVNSSSKPTFDQLPFKEFI